MRHGYEDRGAVLTTVADVVAIRSEPMLPCLSRSCGRIHSAKAPRGGASRDRGLVLAAGEGRRFGGSKLIAELDGSPLLEHVLSAMSATSVDRVVCVLGAGADETLRRVDLHGAEPVLCEGWKEGQAASLRAGIEALAEAEAIVIVLGDQPLLSPAAVERVLAARGGGALAVRATHGNVPSHPTPVERPLFDAMRELRGDRGAQDLLGRVETGEVACDGLGSAADVDTVDDLAALGQRRAKAIGLQTQEKPT